jgi:hypothetical protein
LRISFPRVRASNSIHWSHHDSFGGSKILKRHDFDIVIEDAADRPVD